MRLGESLGLRKVKEAGRELRESDYGGTSHGGEFETSLYLALKPDLVDMSKAVDERSPLSNSFQSDLLAGGHPDGSSANFTPYWSTKTASGVMGTRQRPAGRKGRNSWRRASRG